MLSRRPCRAEFLIAAVLMSFVSSTNAQQVGRIPIIDAPPGTPGLGGGIRFSSDYYDNDSGDADLVPLYLYEGKHLYAHGTAFGVHLFNNNTFQLDLETRYRFTSLETEDDLLLEGLEEREQTWEGGISGSVKGRWGELDLAWFTDVGSKHEGNQADLTYRYRFDFGKWMVSPYVAGMLLDSDITQYYYGVSSGEVRPGRPAYEPGSAVNLEWGVNTWYQLTEHVFIFGNFGFRSLDDVIVDSPIVAEETVALGFIGAGYMFGDQLKQSSDEGFQVRDWSWRVAYGYQAENNIFPDLMSGLIEKSDDADTELAAFTLGKKFQSGKRVDFWGKISAFRHFEDPYQDEFWSFAAHVMAMGKGYMPWSEKLAFRYGFGLGVSYAAEVPIVEQIKQERKGENTNRLLNYLEFQLDFPLDNFIESRFTKNCFLGTTIAHRSGIFGTSDALGSVSGGSDWVMLSYECVR